MLIWYLILWAVVISCLFSVFDSIIELIDEYLNNDKDKWI